jgi:nitroimidazol reductase NimA-like FMN-containing flavoprotein (pyridoxamine 5'-phosphate oxidase superfamily)
MTKLRRAKQEIKARAEIEEVLKVAHVGRLGTCVEGEPYIVPLSFVYDDGRIVFHGALMGKKMDQIAENPKVCFEVDESVLVSGGNSCEYSFNYRSVVINGVARIIQNPERRLNALISLGEKYAPGKGNELTSERFATFKNLAVVEIEIVEMTGKKNPA